MSSLDNLVRISRWQVDEKRRTLADLERLAERLRQDLQHLETGLSREQKVAAHDSMARQTYPGFLDAELNRRDRLRRSIADVDEQISAAREALGESFRELKKYELAKANQEARARQRRARAEQSALDEVGMQMHRRRERGAG